MSIFIMRNPAILAKPNVIPAQQVQGILPPPPIAMTCHYKNKEQTDKAVSSLLANSPETKRVIVVDTSVEQDYTNDDSRVKIINLPGGKHSDGVNFGMNFLYKTQKTRKDKRVLLMDSDVEFFKPIPKLPEGVLVGQLCDRLNARYPIYPRIHPCFCVIDYGYLQEHKIPFHDWSRIANGNELILSNDPKKDVFSPNFRKVREQDSNPWYDVGSTMYEDVKKEGGKIVNYDWSGFMIHKEGGSWRR